MILKKYLLFKLQIATIYYFTRICLSKRRNETAEVTSVVSPPRALRVQSTGETAAHKVGETAGLSL